MLGRWRHRLRRLRALPVGELRDLVQAQWLLLVARMRRRWTPLGRYVDLTPAAVPDTAYTGVLDDRTGALARRLALAIERAAEHGPIRTTCLERAIALDRLLRRHGLTGGRIRVGVRWLDGQFLAHAWVALGDTVLGDSPDRVGAFQSIADARAVAS
jgi:hypothetical protein